VPDLEQATPVPTRQDPAPLTLTITIELARPADAVRLDSAAVDVDFPAQVRQDVLAVPVGTLPALSEGGYAVQVSGGGLVPVRTGLIARGMVEVEGEGGLGEALTSGPARPSTAYLLCDLRHM
jgi:hypothetical protein